MMTTRRSTSVAVGCLLIGVFMGVAGAQVVQKGPSHYLNSGLFTVAAGEGARFSVALDDFQGALPAQVTLQLHDEDGAVMTGKTVTLQAGQSAILETRQAGIYRAHARVVEPSQPPSGRRVAVGSVEVHDIDDLLLRRRYVCVGGLGRIPDAPVN
jgi:hypothetical protein